MSTMTPPTAPAAAALSAEQLADLLHRILHSIDNNERRQAEGTVVQALHNPSTLIQLVHILCGAPSTGVRQLAAVLLRKKVFVLWHSLALEARAELRALLYSRLEQEPARVVRFAVAHIVARLAKADTRAALQQPSSSSSSNNNTNNTSSSNDGRGSESEAGWATLQRAITSAVQDARSEVRELAMVLLYSFGEILDEVADYQDEAEGSERRNAASAQLTQMQEAAAAAALQGMRDADDAVARAALKAVSALLTALRSRPAIYARFVRALVPQCLELLHQALPPQPGTAPPPPPPVPPVVAVNHGKRVGLYVAVLDLLQQLLPSLSVKKYGPLLLQSSRALLAVMTSATVPALVRENCGTTLSELTNAKPKFVVSSQLLQGLVDGCLQLMSEDDSIFLPDDAMEDTTTSSDSDDDEGNNNNEKAGDNNDNNDDDDGEDEMLSERANTPCMTGGYLLSSVGLAVAPKAFIAALVPTLQSLTADNNNTNNTSIVSNAEGAVVSARRRKAAMIALSCMTESCPSYLRRRIDFVLDVTARFLHDTTSPVTREAAALALSFFCSNLQPEILQHAGALLPLLQPLLRDGSDLVRRRTAQALETLCEEMDAGELEGVVDELLPSVLQALQNSSLATQRSLCAVIAAMAASGESSPALCRHAAGLFELLRLPFASLARETNALRAAATATVGAVAVAVGQACFAPYLPFFMSKVIENLHTSEAALREQSFGFLANLCTLLHEGFAPYLEDTVSCALRVIDTEEKLVYAKKHPFAGAGAALPSTMQDQLDAAHPSPSAAIGGGNEGQDGAEAGQGNEDSEDEADVHIRVRTADVEEKAAAVHCLGVVAQTLRGKGVLTPELLMRCWSALSELDRHFYPTIWANALIASAKVLTALHGGTAVVQTTAADTLSPELRHMLDDFMDMNLLYTMSAEAEKDVVVACAEAMVCLLEFFGLQTCAFGPDAVVKECIQLLRQKRPCQVNNEEEDDSDDGEGDGENNNGDTSSEHETASSTSAYSNMFAPYEDDDEDDEDDEDNENKDDTTNNHTSNSKAQKVRKSWVGQLPIARVVQHVRLAEAHDADLFEALTDLLEALARVYGGGLAPHYAYLFPLLALYADCATRPAEDVVMAMGCLATMHERLGPSVSTAYVETLVPLCFAVITHCEDPAACSNSAYCLRVLIDQCPGQFATGVAVRQTLQTLGTLIVAEENVQAMPEAVDNATSATCSLLRGVPAGLIPWADVMPPLLAHIPMRVDRAENANALQLLGYLCTVQAGAVLSTAAWLTEFAACVARVRLAASVDDTLKQSLVQGGVRVFAATYAAVWRQACAALTPELQAALQDTL